MPNIRFDFGTLTIEAELADTPTAKAVLAKLPYDARAIVTPGEVAYWPDGPCIALGYTKQLARVKAGAKVRVSVAD
jgi:hypothetical protein